MTISPMQNLLNKVATTVSADRGVQAEIAEVLNVSEPFVSRCVKRGWFPLGRARALADKYEVPFAELISPAIRNQIQP